MGAVSSFLHAKSDSEMIPSRQVKTRYGIVEGRRVIDEGEFQVDAFMGIPFAKPPIGPLRFKKPEPPDSWQGVLKTVKFGPRAPQTDFIWEKWTLGVGKAEDCLRLNVFSPAWKLPDDQPKGFAVMVFVHGGGFLIDSAVKYGDIGICRYLCRHDVIVVTVQYRLGFLGFFSTGDQVCPGNLGLWDQTMALKWVQDNISSFNGDPNRITVFGQSAGGASVDLLSLSPESRDLFQQVIPMAGNADCDWAVTDKRRIMNACKRFARKAGWNGSFSGVKDRIRMMDFLRKKPAKLFERGLLGRGGVELRQIGLDLAPTIDGEFLPRPIAELRKEAPKKKCMVGACQYEGLLFASLGPKQFTVKGIDNLLSIAIPEDKFRNWKELREEARRLYLTGEQPPTKLDIIKAYINLYSDLFVNNGTYSYAKSMTKAGHQVYLYSFDYFNPKSFGILSLRMPFKGATHCTELTYLFGLSVIFPFKLNEQDMRVMDLMTELWSNFAKYGNPNGSKGFVDFKWKPVDAEETDRYLCIGEKTKMKQKYTERRAEFWENLKLNKQKIEEVRTHLQNSVST